MCTLMCLYFEYNAPIHGNPPTSPGVDPWNSDRKLCLSQSSSCHEHSESIPKRSMILTFLI